MGFVLFLRFYTYFQWFNFLSTVHKWASLVVQMIKNLSAMWESQIWSLGWEDLLERKMAPHSSILAWRIPWREEPGWLQSKGSKRVGHDWATILSFILKWSNPEESKGRTLGMLSRAWGMWFWGSCSFLPISTPTWEQAPDTVHYTWTHEPQESRFPTSHDLEESDKALSQGTHPLP